MATAPKRGGAATACPFCNRAMSTFRSSNRWLFFRCPTDGYWTARDHDGNWPSYEYSDSPDFQQRQECEWDKIVEQTREIMRRKFMLARKSGGAFLDIGCSEGSYVAGAAALGWSAVGTEIDGAKISRAQSRGLDVRRVDLPSDVAQLPQADFVMLRHVLEHVPDFVPFAAAAASAVAQGGVLWIECPNQAGLSVRRTRTVVKEDRYLGALYPPSHIHAFEPKSFRRLGERLGLACETIVTYGTFDANWSPPYQSSTSRLKGALHRLFALLGYDNHIAVLYRK